MDDLRTIARAIAKTAEVSLPAGCQASTCSSSLASAYFDDLDPITAKSIAGFVISGCITRLKPSRRQVSNLALTARKPRTKFGKSPNLTPEEHKRRGDAADALSAR